MSRLDWERGSKGGTGTESYTAGTVTRNRENLSRIIEISPDKISRVARMFLVDGDTQEEIATVVGVKKSMVAAICQGRKCPYSWASAVGDLIVAGYDVAAGKKIRAAKAFEKAHPHGFRRRG